MRASLASARAASAAGAMSSEEFRSLLAELRSLRGQIATAELPRTAATVNLVTVVWDYAGAIGADFNAIEAALASTGNWLAARGGTLWTGYAIDGTTWNETIPVFTPAQTAGFRTEADALIAAIDVLLNNIR